MQNSTNNKTILKNTIYLYVRMIFTMVVSLYTSRIVLDVLGVDDYGVYNVIGGVVVLISLINNSMSAATQRFITFELSKNDHKRVSNTFCMSMTIHLFVCILIIIIGETIGLYYVQNYLNVAPMRQTAAFWVYQISLVTVIANIIRVPYNASIIAYERMNFFAIISILEVMLQLLMVFVLSIIQFDKLILYGFLMLIITVICTIVYKIYCQKMFNTCTYHYVMDKAYFKELLGYTGWNFVGAIATAGSTQVGNMLLNFFCGPAVNAAYGVATRVNAAILGLSNNFQVAYTPQIIKLYSRDERIALFNLLDRAALLSYYLLFILAAPLCFCIDYILSIWLVEVPAYTGCFIVLLIIYNLIDALQAPFWKVISATGNIKYYAIWLNSLMILNIPITYFLLKSGYKPYFVLVVSVLLNLISSVIRCLHVKIQIKVSIKRYIKNVLLRVFVVTVIYCSIASYIKEHTNLENILSFLVFYVISIFFILFIIYLFGINKHDRMIIVNNLRTKFCKRKIS